MGNREGIGLVIELPVVFDEVMVDGGDVHGRKMSHPFLHSRETDYSGN